MTCYQYNKSINNKEIFINIITDAKPKEINGMIQKNNEIKNSLFIVSH